MSVFNQEFELFVKMFSNIFLINAKTRLRRLDYTCSYPTIYVFFFLIRFDNLVGQMPNTKIDLLFA